MRVFSRLAPIISQFTSDEEVYVDIGSSRTRIITKSSVLCNQPTCMAVHTPTRSVVAIGERAYQLLGKVVPGIEVQFPVHNGKITDEFSFSQFLTALTKKYIKPSPITNIIGVHGLIGISHSQTPAQREIIHRSMVRAGWHRVLFKDSAVAITAAVAPSKLKSGHVAICDIGGTQTEISVVSVGAVSYSQHIAWGGLSITNLLQEHIHRNNQLAVGWHTIEALKREMPIIASKSKKKQSIKRSIRGKDVVTQTAKTVVLDSSEFTELLESFLNELLFELKGFIGILPTELSSDILKSGIYLSGSGSELHGLPDYLSEELQTSVIRSEEPGWDVVRGLLVISKQES